LNNADWWAKKLQQQQPPAPPARTQSLPVAPSQTPMQSMPQIQQQRDPAERAMSAKQTQNCPECYSQNYMAVSNAAPRCYDCGYPIQQSGSRYGALTGAHVEGDTKGARGNDATNNYNPQNIIGRIE
jgi:ribosomal protein L37AE/L43A